MEEVNYGRLKANTGIDFEQLKQKYQNISKLQQQESQQRRNSEEDEEYKKQQEERDRKRQENESAMKRLDGYKICKVCHGQGTIREVYNHFNIEKTCPECDGESVLFVDLKTLLEP